MTLGNKFKNLNLADENCLPVTAWYVAFTSSRLVFRYGALPLVSGHAKMHWTCIDTWKVDVLSVVLMTIPVPSADSPKACSALLDDRLWQHDFTHEACLSEKVIPVAPEIADATISNTLSGVPCGTTLLCASTRSCSSTAGN